MNRLFAFLKALRERWRVNRRLRFTRAGTFVVTLTVGVGLGALNTGNNLIYIVFGGLLGLIAASGLVSERMVQDLELDWLLPGELHAGRPATLRLIVRNLKKKSASVGIDVEAAIAGRDGAARAEARLLAVPPGGQRRADIEFRPPSRGRHDLRDLTISTFFPFGLFRKTALLPPGGSFVVYPSVDRALPDRILPEGSDQARPLAKRGEGDTFWGTREFQTGDSPRRISWKTSARLGKLIVRETELESETEVVVSLGARERWRALRPEQLEDAVSFAASLAARLFDAGAALGYRADDLALPPSRDRRTLGRALEHLALFDPAAAPGEAAAGGAGGTEIDVLSLWRTA